MTYSEARDRFIARVCSGGWSVDQARSILRMATTADRLAVAMCNGDYPADNGQRPTVECSVCEGHWVKSSMTKDRTVPKVQREGESKANWVPMICPDCRNERRIKALVNEVNVDLPTTNRWKVKLAGDPRGYVVTLIPPTSRGEDYSSDNVGVPTRNS